MQIFFIPNYMFVRLFDAPFVLLQFDRCKVVCHLYVPVVWNVLLWNLVITGRMQEVQIVSLNLLDCHSFYWTWRRDHFFHHSFHMHSSPVLLGLSLKTQVLTAIFLAVRLYCSFLMEADIHTVLDFITLVATVWVIYMMKFKLKASYMAELDNMPLYYPVHTTFTYDSFPFDCC